MTAASEMIYMPMSVDDRYLGKEVIRFFGHKLGKSGSSVLLSSAVAKIQPSMSTMYFWTGFATLLWGAATYTLAVHLLQREASSANHGNLDHSGDVAAPAPEVSKEGVALTRDMPRAKQEMPGKVLGKSTQIARKDSFDECQSSTTTSESAEAPDSGVLRSRSSSDYVAWAPLEGEGEGDMDSHERLDNYTESEDVSPSPPQQWWMPTKPNEPGDVSDSKNGVCVAGVRRRRRLGDNMRRSGISNDATPDIYLSKSSNSLQDVCSNTMPQQRTRHRHLNDSQDPNHQKYPMPVTEDVKDASAGFILRIGSVLTSLSALVEQYPSLNKSTSTPTLADVSSESGLSRKSSGGFNVEMEGIPEE